MLDVTNTLSRLKLNTLRGSTFLSLLESTVRANHERPLSSRARLQRETGPHRHSRVASKVPGCRAGSLTAEDSHYDNRFCLKVWTESGGTIKSIEFRRSKQRQSKSTWDTVPHDNDNFNNDNAAHYDYHDSDDDNVGGLLDDGWS